MRTRLLTLTTLVMMLAATTAMAKKVHTLGDSTMAPYEESATVTRGWGMYFGNFLTNGWTCVNYARGGRDSRGGYEELWQTAKAKVESGDYVIISFGHNDEKNGGMDGMQLYNYYVSIGDMATASKVEKRGSIPSTTYKENLGKIVDEVLQRGGIPIIASPVCRSYFSGGKIRRNGRHDLGDSFSVLGADGPTTGHKVPQDDRTMDYAYHAQQLAQEKGIAFVDLTSATATLYEQYGDAKCHEFLFDGEGSTHFNTTGALLVARECARLMKEQGIMADDIVLPTDLSVAPMSVDFGEAYKGQTVVKEFTVSGFGLTPEEGTVSVSASDGLLVSTDKVNWQGTLGVGYQASTVVKTIYVQITLDHDGASSGTVTVQQGDKTITVPVTATAISLEGGSPIQAYWRLESDATCEMNGPATVIDESWVGMYVQRYSNPNAKTTWPEWTGYEATRKTQRNLLTGDVWPDGEIDDNPDRYIQFGIKPNKGNTLKINNISLFICGCGGNGMCSHIYYSTDNFATRTTIFEMKKMPANNMQEVKATPVVSLEGDQELLVRIYPWYNGSASGKTICLSDVTISGIALDASGVRAVGSDRVVGATFYGVDGRQYAVAGHGLNIMRAQMADGTVVVRKFIK